MSLKYFMIATLLASALAGQAQEAEPRLDIIPEPREVKHVGDSSFQLRPGTPVRVNDAALDFTASYLAGYTDRYLGIPLQAVPSPKKGKRKASAADEAGRPGIYLENLSNGGPEGGYVLRVSADGGVRVSGNDAAGVFYGVQTLIQMLPTRAGVLPFLPPLRITLEIIAVKILCQTPVILEHRISQPVGRLTVQAPNELLQLAVGFRVPVFQNFYLPAVFRPFFQDTQHTVQLNKPGKLRIFPFVPSDEGVN